MKGLPRPSRLYDAVVLGSELPALAAGALLAKRGWRILSVEDGRSPPYLVEGALRVPLQPRLLPSVQATPSLRALLGALGLLPTTGRLIEPYPRGLQVILPGVRLDLGADEAKRAAELQRAFGAAGFPLRGGPEEEEWEKLSERLPPLGFLGRWALRPLAKWAGELEWERLGPLAPVFAGMHELVGGGAPTELAFARATYPLVEQPALLQQKSLGAVLRASIEAQRGDLLGSVEAPVAIEEIVLERGAFAGVRLAGQSEPYRGRIALAGMAPALLASLLPPSRKRRKLEARAEGLQAERRRYALGLVLRDAARPPGLAELAFVGGGSGAPALLCLHPAQGADGKEVAEAFGLSTLGTFPAAWSEEQAIEALRARVEEALPFHRRHLLAEGARALGWSGIRAERGGAAAGLPLQSPFRGLLQVSPWVLPALGFEGALLSAFQAAAVAQTLGGKIR